MKFISIQKKLVLLSVRLLSGAVGVFLFSLVVLGVYNANRIFSNIETQTTENLIGKGNLLVSNNSIALRGMAEDNAFSGVRELVVSTVKMDKDIVSGVYIDINNQPWVVVDSENPDGKEEIDLRNNLTCNWAVSVTKPSHKKIIKNSNELIAFAAPVLIDEERLGTIFYELSTSSMKIAITASKRKYFIEAMIFAAGMFGIAGFLFIVGFQATRRQAKSITKPLDELTNAASIISQGDYSFPVQTNSNDEVGVLAKNFEVMRKTIKKYTDSLEQMVEERTKELKKANEALKDAEAKTRSLLENSPDFIINTNRDFIIQYINRLTEGATEKDVVGKLLFDFVIPEDLEDYRKAITGVLETGESDILETRIQTPDREYRWFENRFAAIKGNGSVEEVMVIVTEITKRKKAEAELELANKQLVDTAHQAGMADIASGTLHNVGNILNSVKTSAQVIEDIMQRSKMEGFKKANALLMENIDTLDTFIVEDPKGKKLMEYYLKIEDILAEEHKNITKHLSRLAGKIDAIVEVIAAQQSYAGSQTLSDKYSIPVVIEDALTMQSGIIERYNITVFKDFKDMPEILIQKTKLVHILINLIRNARDAMLETPTDERLLKICIYCEDKVGYIKVMDSGHGIPKEELKKIFNHGYTTKKEGHGFGLHSCANYMTEMGGTMWAESEGKGKGATFILKFKL